MKEDRFAGSESEPQRIEPPRRTGLWFGPLRKRRFAAVEQLENDNARLLHLVNTLDERLRAESDQVESLRTELTRLSETVERLAESDQRRLAMLTSISDAVLQGAGFMRQAQETLSQWPQIADNHRETLVAVSRRLEASNESADRLAGKLEEMNHAAASLRQTAQLLQDAAERSGQDAASREERLVTELRQQSRRLSLACWSAIALAIVAAAAALAALFR